MSQWEETENAVNWISFRSLGRCAKAGQLMYILYLHAVRGLFQFDLQQDLERRLMHRNEFFAHDLAIPREAQLPQRSNTITSSRWFALIQLPLQSSTARDCRLRTVRSSCDR